MNKIVIKNDRIDPLKTGHPWVFSGSLEQKYTDISLGEIVELVDNKGNFLAYGFYNFNQSIAFRVISFNKDDKVNEDFFFNKINSLLALKKSLLSLDTNGFRLVNADADYLAGLIVDVYDDLAVFQISIIGMENCRDHVIASLKRLGFKHIIEKSDSNSRLSEGLEIGEVYLICGEQKEFYSFLENGVTMLSDPFYGQKTGYFLDQRDARTWVKNHSKDKVVINLFSYSGAFSVSSLIGGAIEVKSIDISQKALDLAEKILSLNDFKGKHFTLKVDVLDYVNQNNDLKNIKDKIIICDPPAFAKNKGALKNATNAYVKLNTKCLSNMNSGDILVSSSCSGLIKMEDFHFILKKASVQSGKKVRILAEFKQSFDHTMMLGFKEGEYLKTLILQVI